MFNRLILILLVAPLILAGCASQPAVTKSTRSATLNQQHIASLASIQQFKLKGRIGVITQKQGFSGGINWQHQANNDAVQVYSPLGSKVADIIKTPTEVTLTSQDGNSVKAESVETLTEMALGWKIPLTGLNDWAIGRPATGTIEAVTWDELGRIITLKQNGWDISYENYTENNGYFLPSKILLKSEKLNLKLLVENWSNLPH